MCNCRRTSTKAYLGQTTDYDPNDERLDRIRQTTGRVLVVVLFTLYALAVLAAWIVPAVMDVRGLS